MKKNKLEMLHSDDLPPRNIEEYMYSEGIMEREFEFFKGIYMEYEKIVSGHLGINKEIYEKLFNCDNYWDKVYNFKSAFDSNYHYFSKKIYKEYLC